MGAAMAMIQTPEAAAAWLRARVSGRLRTDSRQVSAGDGLLAWPGASTDAREHVRDVLAVGAQACLVEAQGAEAFDFDDARIAGYAGLKRAAGPIAAAYFDAPSDHLDLVAVTGTNGKTSTAWWLAHALSQPQAGRAGPCGLVGTLGIGRPGRLQPSGLTSPDPVLLQASLRQFVDQGLSACAIEASSVGLAERRLDGLRVRVAIFTNFTQDHLDYHGSMQAYWQAKAGLFRWPGLRAAVLNLDDPRGAELARQLAGSGIELWTYSCAGPARLSASAVEHQAQGLRLLVHEGAERHELRTVLAGQFNASNLLAVLGGMRALGVPLEQAVAACGGLQPVPGRMESVQAAGQPLVVVDYAHTPDALDKVLAGLRPLAAQRGGRLWCLFGCGGNRDRLKRPLMAAIALAQADRVVVTSDNPRDEPAQAIVDQILAGIDAARIGQVLVVLNRAEAIEQALMLAAAPDVVLLAGKGHEDYQEVAGVRHPFSDRLHAAQVLRRRAAQARSQGVAA